MTTVVEAFQRWVAATPDAVAVSAGADTLTYAELDRWSNELAHQLIREFGVRQGDRVAVCLPRSTEMIVAVLGVIHAGAVYLPIDVGDPPQRVGDVVTDAGATVAIVSDETEERFAAHALRTLFVPPPGGASSGLSTVDTAEFVHIHDDDILYMMYTSGSTGKPKAVMTMHRNVTNLVANPNYVRLGPQDRLLQLAPVAFDAATLEIWGALLNGGRVVLAPPGQVQPEELAFLLRDNDITVLWLTAALFHRQIDVDPKALAGVRTVLSGGDVLSPPHIKTLLAECPDLEIVNGYGPTETTTFATCYPIPRDRELGNSVPIGFALQNVDLQVVDEGGRPVPDGTDGELWIGGAGVSKGYWQRPELTAEKYVTGTWPGASGIYYRSGDQVRRRPEDGAIEFLGRLDDQFKLRGFRIEPGEVENVLAGNEQVRAAAVAVRLKDGAKQLVAWIVPAGDELNRRQLRKYLKERVPDHMVPNAFVTVDELPINANGKLDRKALPEPDWSSRSIYI